MSDDPEKTWAFKAADSTLHTGSEQDVTPEELVMASGQDLTPELIEKARKDLEKYGPAAIEKYMP